MKLATPRRVRAAFNKACRSTGLCKASLWGATWGRLTQRQRRVLAALGMVNLLALSALVVLLLRPPSPLAPRPSPLAPQHLEACRQQLSRALLDAGQAGLVQTQADGTILLQLQRPQTALHDPSLTSPQNPKSEIQNPKSNSLRLDADGAIWAALEAVAAASRGDCLAFKVVNVTVLLPMPEPPSRGPPAVARQGQGAGPGDTSSSLRATARVALPDLLLWSLGEIDDAELALRINYQPPATTTPTSEP
jgi:hypothetical protein